MILLIITLIGPTFGIFIGSLNNSEVEFNLLRQYPDHMLVLHYDNDSVNNLTPFFKQHTTPRTLYNYDTAVDIRRPPGHNFINIVYLRKWNAFKTFSNIENNIKYEDVIMFVTRMFTPNMKETFYYKGIENANAIFIFDIGKMTVHHIQFFNNQHGFLVEIPVDNEGILDLSPYKNTFQDFKSFEMKIAYGDCEPFIYTLSNGTVDGVELKVLELMEKMLNFKMKLIDFSNNSFPRTAMVNAVHKGEVHIAAGCLSNTIKRNQLVHFTSDIRIESHISLYSSSGYQKNSFFILVMPFEVEVWLYLFVSIGLMGVLLKKIMDFLLGFQEANFLDYIKIPFRTMVEQPVNLQSNKSALRLVFVGWILVAMIITNSYKSKLSSSLIKPATNEPNSLSDLVKHQFQFEIPSNDPTFLKETLGHSNDYTFKKVLQRWHQGSDMCTSIRKTLTNRLAIIQELTMIKYEFWNKCVKLLTKQEIDSIRLTKQNIFPNSHAWALQRDAPFNKRFTTGLELLQSTGMISKWYNSYELQRPIRMSNQDIGSDERKPLNLEILFAPFIVLISGCISSLIGFICELLHYRCHHNGIIFKK